MLENYRKINSFSNMLLFKDKNKNTHTPMKYYKKFTNYSV